MLKANDPSLSRREFLTTAVGAGGAMLFGQAWLHAAGDGVDPRVAQVMSKTIGIDMHNHVYPAGTEPHPQNGQPPRQEEQQQGPGLFLAEELKRSGLTAVCASFVLDFAPFTKPGDAWDHYRSWLTAMDAQLEKGHMHRALNLKDLQRPRTPMVNRPSSRRWKGHSSSRGAWSEWKRYTSAVCATFNCFTSETTSCRRWGM
jgi:membrane dipeptidase